MGKGDLAKIRWKNDRIRKKKARDKRQAEEAHRERTGAADSATATSSS